MPYRKGANLPSYFTMIIVKWIILVLYIILWLCIVVPFFMMHVIVKSIVFMEAALHGILLALESWIEHKLDML